MAITVVKFWSHSKLLSDLVLVGNLSSGHFLQADELHILPLMQNIWAKVSLATSITVTMRGIRLQQSYFLPDLFVLANFEMPESCFMSLVSKNFIFPNLDRFSPAKQLLRVFNMPTAAALLHFNEQEVLGFSLDQNL